MTKKAPRWAWVVATGLGSGRLRPAPGTWGSLSGLAAWCLLSLLLATPFSTWVLGHQRQPHLGYYIYGVELLFLLAPLAMTWMALRSSDLVVAETGHDLQFPEGWMVARQRRYGATVVTVARPAPRSDGHSDAKGGL